MTRPSRAPTTGRLRLAALALALAGGTGTVVAACSRPPDRSPEAFCERLGPVKDLDAVLAEGDAARARDRVAQLRDLQASAPEELEPHVGRLAALTDELARTVGSTPDGHAAATDVFARHQADLPDIVRSGQVVERFAADRCHVVLNPTGDTAADAPRTSAPATTNAPASSTRTTRPSATTPTSRAGSVRRPSTTRTPTSRRSATTATRPTTTRPSATTRR